jgi:hypothetical protein
MKEIKLKIIGFIAIVIAFIILIIMMQKKSTKITHIKSEMMQIKMGIEMYVSTFKEFPIEEHDNISTYATNSRNEFLMNMLTSKNSKKMRFLHAPIIEDLNNQPYQIYLDVNWDNKIEFYDQIIEDRILIYSYGLNGKDEKGKGDDLSTHE